MIAGNISHDIVYRFPGIGHCLDVNPSLSPEPLKFLLLCLIMRQSPGDLTIAIQMTFDRPLPFEYKDGVNMREAVLMCRIAFNECYVSISLS